MIQINGKSVKQKMTLVLFIGPFLIAPLIEFLKLPDMIRYALDVTWLLLLIFMIFTKKRNIGKNGRTLLTWVVMFFLFTLINYVAHYQSIFYYLWGFRNNFRGFVLFFAVIYYLDESIINKSLRTLDLLFYINAAIMMIQFFALGYQWDNLGGIFGVETGCNAYVNLFFCIMLAKSYIFFYEKKISLLNFAIKSVIMLALASLAELKYFYIESIVIILSASLITKFSIKKVFVIAIFLIALIIGYNVIMAIFPNTDLSVEYLFEYASTDAGYTARGDMNRLTFLSDINKRYLTTTAERLFGLGLGNCDYATGIELVSSPFYKLNGWTHYTWMSSAFMYLENGWLGLIFFGGFFIINSIMSLRFIKNGGSKIHCQISFLCGIVALLNAFYNISLRIESGYILYYILAIPWCMKKA